MSDRPTEKYPVTVKDAVKFRIIANCVNMYFFQFLDELGVAFKI